MKRCHALDSLRASMMLLGIWLHSVVGYSRQGGWPYKDAHPTAVYDWTLGLIHTFRMPIFFLMAGFFGALLWARGRHRFVENRIQRILVPFALFWAAMFPAVMWMAAYSKLWNHVDGPSRAIGYIMGGGFLEQAHPMHMWFLEYLLVLYAIAFAVVTLAQLGCRSAWFASVLRRGNGWYRAAVGSRWRPLIFAAPYAGAMMLMHGAYLEDPPGFVPVPRIVIAYTVPFFFGWLLYLNRDLLDTFPRYAWRQVGMGLALMAAWMAFVDPVQNRPEYWHWVKPLRAAAGSLLLWLLAFGLTGLALRYLNTERPLGRYLSDGSYWIYLMHMPVVMGFQMALAGFGWPAAAKAPIVVALSVPVLVLSYDLLVRETRVGVLLNGRRYPRRFIVRPAAEPQPEAAGRHY
jgi:glucan biosynthesis protein C